MSFNIMIYAEGRVRYPNKRYYKLVERFSPIQTPTEVTFKIMDSNNPVKEYIDWLEYDIDKYDRVIDVNDCEIIDPETDYYKVIGTEVINFRKDHLQEFKLWVKEERKKGMKLVFDYI